MSFSRKSVVVAQRIPPKALGFLKSISGFDVEVWNDDKPMPDDEMCQRLGSAYGILLTLESKIQGDLLKSIGPNLKCISTMTVGYDHLDAKALRSLGVRIGNTPNVLTDTTAELVVALLLATSRRLIESHKALLNGEVGKWNPNWMCGKDLKNSTIGFVGFGRIAQTVAKILSSFSVEKFYYSTRSFVCDEETLKAIRTPCERIEINEMLPKCDFIIILCSSNESTKLMVNRGFLSKMKEDSILINGSRGDVVDQDALVAALKEGTIRGAGLDVTTPEPLPAHHPLLHLPNCTVLPHIGSASVNTREAMALLAVENLKAALEDRPMPAEVMP